MTIIVSFFCGMALITLADALADYISAKADQIRKENNL